MMEQEQLMEEKENLEKVYLSGGKALKFRCFIEKDNSKNFPNLAEFN